jgi:two-component system, OmpR family, response regulator
MPTGCRGERATEWVMVRLVGVAASSAVPLWREVEHERRVEDSENAIGDHVDAVQQAYRALLELSMGFARHFILDDPDPRLAAEGVIAALEAGLRAIERTEQSVDPGFVEPGPELRRIVGFDDEKDLREVAAFSLEIDDRLEIRACGSGEAALEACAERMPDVLLLNMMPRLDGPEMLARLRAMPGGDTLPVIFFTARAQADEVAALFALGAADVIAKPFEASTLAQRVHRVVALRS